MRGVMFYEPGKVKVENIPEPTLEEGDIKIQVELSGICGSDIKTYRRGTPYTIPPAVLGHEVVGTVIETRSVKWQVGDRVAVAHYIPCGSCSSCLAGNGTLCPDLFKRRIDPGGFVEKVRVPRDLAERATFKISDRANWETAVLAEPLACCIHAARNLSLAPGNKVLIIGDGPMGLLHVETVKAFSGVEVILSGMTPQRLKAAQKLAHHVIDAKNENVVERVKEITGGEGPHHIIVAVPSIEAAEQALEMVRPGGEVLLFGGFPKDCCLKVDPNKFHYDEVKLFGTAGSLPQEFKMALDFLESGKVNQEHFITHIYSMDKAGIALERGMKQEGIKAVIQPSAPEGTIREL